MLVNASLTTAKVKQSDLNKTKTGQTMENIGGDYIDTNGGMGAIS